MTGIVWHCCANRQCMRQWNISWWKARGIAPYPARTFSWLGHSRTLRLLFDTLALHYMALNIGMGRFLYMVLLYAFDLFERGVMCLVSNTPLPPPPPFRFSSGLCGTGMMISHVKCFKLVCIFFIHITSNIRGCVYSSSKLDKKISLNPWKYFFFVSFQVAWISFIAWYKRWIVLFVPVE